MTFNGVWGVCEPTTSLLGTYTLVRKAPRSEVGTSLTILATGSEDMGYSGEKVRNAAEYWCVG